MTYLRNFIIQTFLNFEFFVLNHSYGYLGVYFMDPRVQWQNSFLFLRVLPLNPGIHEIHSQIAVGVTQNKKFKI